MGRIAKYGISYQGSKSRIADEIMAILPSGKRFVDLFGGGGAMTHCAMLSGKYETFLYNDINKLITDLFIGAINGKYKDERRIITKDEFHAQKNTDGYVKYIWSFGNNGNTYLWSNNIADIKIQACKMLTAETLRNRRLEYRRFIKLVNEYRGGEISPQLKNLENLERLERLQSLQSLQSLQNLEVSNIDYRDYVYQEGDVVYCDVPYERIHGQKVKCYGVDFDSLAFYEWAKTRPYQVYFSSYEIFDDAFYCLPIKEISQIIGSTTNKQKQVEYLYSNKPFKKTDYEQITMLDVLGESK